MEFLPLALVLASAVSHGLWNYMAKEGKDKESFMLLLNLTSLPLLLPVFLLVLPEIYLPLDIVPYLLVSGLAETVYFLGLGKAYESGDLSIVYPVARSSPVFVTIAAAIFLGETISLIGLLGILVIFIGVYILHLKGMTRKDLVAPVRYLMSGSSRYAVIAALGTTVYSITDKLGVTTVDPLLYSFWLGFSVTGMMTIVTLKRKGFKAIRDEFSSHEHRACELHPCAEADQRGPGCPHGRGLPWRELWQGADNGLSCDIRRGIHTGRHGLNRV